MTLTPLKSMLAAAAALVSLFAPATEAARAGKQLPYAPELVGTWSTKSETVMTGPDFYDPVSEKLKEPRLPGISYSFTLDGHFEEAQYIVLPNPTTPTCPSAMLQFQHGEYKLFDNGSMVLYPIAVDGRQLLSEPCRAKTAIYSRYNSTSVMKGWAVLTDTYRSRKRLNLFRFDGSPVNPMWLVSPTPTMLPTTTLNPLPANGEEAEKKSKDGQKRRARLRRSLEESVGIKGWGLKQAEDLDPERWLWIGVGLTALGAVGFFCV